MRSLQGLKTKVAELLAAHRAQLAEPQVVVFLPNNSRGPAYAGPWPRIQRAGNVTTVVYRIENGQPVLDGKPVSENRTETHSKGNQS